MAKPNLLTQARIFTDKLNRNQKIIITTVAGLTLAGVIALIIALYQPPETTTLFSGLASTDASNVIEYLKANNIKYELQPTSSGENTIIVQKEGVEELRMAIMSQNLIEDSSVGYELFDKTNLGMSEYVQQLNSRRALEGEIQRTIKKGSPEIKDVRVHLVIPKNTLFKEQQQQPTAAIKLSFKNRNSQNKVDIAGIQRLVAGSVEGMKINNVVVTDSYGRVLSEDIPDENSLAGITDAQLKQQKQKENYLTEKVQSLLDPAFGAGNSKVKLNVEIDFDQLEVNKTDYDPERQVERSQQTINEHTTDVDTSFVPGTNFNDEKTNELINYEITKADSHYVRGVGGIRRLTVTAIINEKITVQRIPNTVRDTVISTPRTEEELRLIENSIRNTLGYSEERGDQINVICLPFTEILADKVTEVNEYNRVNSVQWYEKEDTQRLLLLLATLLITAAVMFKIIHAKFSKDKMRIAMGLPEKLAKPALEKFDTSLLVLPKEEEIEEEEEEEDLLAEGSELGQLEEYIGEEELTVEEIMDDLDESIEEMDLEEEDILMIPDDLPEQLFLSSDMLDEMDVVGEMGEEMVDESGSMSDSILERARQALAYEEVTEDITEDALMKEELRDKITAFIVGSPEVAVKLFRVFYNQDA